MATPILSLKGKVAVITGAASGIGASVAHLFLKSGVRGLVLADADKTKLQKEFKDVQDICDCISVDVSTEVDAQRYVTGAVKRWGQLDIAVLNAGVCEASGSILNKDLRTFDRIMSTNVQGVFLGIKHAGRAMMNNPGGPSGSIVVTSSQLGLEAAPGLAAYSTSKFAVRGLALNAAEELAPHIRVNSVCPGPVETPLLKAIQNWEELRDKTLLKRIAQPDEIANAIGWLASDASFCTGTTLKVDGGYSKMG